VDHGTYSNFEIDGNKANQTTGTGHNIRADVPCSNLRFENIYTHDSQLHGFILAIPLIAGPEHLCDGNELPQ
jgi:hypothetical protein